MKAIRRPVSAQRHSISHCFGERELHMRVHASFRTQQAPIMYLQQH